MVGSARCDATRDTLSRFSKHEIFDIHVDVAVTLQDIILLNL